jgi:hypothetical protein
MLFVLSAVKNNTILIEIQTTWGANLINSHSKQVFLITTDHREQIFCSSINKMQEQYKFHKK